MMHNNITSSPNPEDYSHRARLENVFGFPLPFIKRKSETFTSYDVLTQKILLNYFRTTISQELFDCIPFNRLHMIRMGYRDAQEFNRIMNNDLGQGSMDCHIFKPGQLLVSMDTVKEIVTFLETCHDLFINNIKENHLFGFILIDNKYECPFVWNNGKQLAPLFFFDGDSEYLDSLVEELQDPWQCSYLQLCCKIRKIRREYFDQYPLKVVDLADIKALYPPGTSFELNKLADVNQELLVPEHRVDVAAQVAQSESYEDVSRKVQGNSSLRFTSSFLETEPHNVITGVHDLDLQQHLPNSINSSLQGSCTLIENSIHIQRNNTLNTSFLDNLRSPTSSVQIPDHNRAKIVAFKLQENPPNALGQNVETIASSVSSPRKTQHYDPAIMAAEIQENNLRSIHHEQESNDVAVRTRDLLWESDRKTMQSSVPKNKAEYMRNLGLKRRNSSLISTNNKSVPESTTLQKVNPKITYENPVRHLHKNITKLTVQDSVDLQDYHHRQREASEEKYNTPDTLSNLQQKILKSVRNSKKIDDHNTFHEAVSGIRGKKSKDLNNALQESLRHETHNPRRKTRSSHLCRQYMPDDKIRPIDWETIQKDLNTKRQRTKEHLKRVLGFCSSAANPIQEHNREKLREQIKELRIVLDLPRQPRKDRSKVKLKDQTSPNKLDTNCVDGKQHELELNERVMWTKDLPKQSNETDIMQPTESAIKPKKRNLSLKRKNNTLGLSSTTSVPEPGTLKNVNQIKELQNIQVMRHEIPARPQGNNTRNYKDQNTVEHNSDAVPEREKNSYVEQVNTNSTTTTSTITTTKSRYDFCLSYREPKNRLTTSTKENYNGLSGTSPVVENIDYVMYKLDPHDVLAPLSEEATDSCKQSHLLVSEGFLGETIPHSASIQHHLEAHVQNIYCENGTSNDTEIIDNVQRSFQIERKEPNMNVSTGKYINKNLLEKCKKQKVADQNSNTKQLKSTSMHKKTRSLQILTNRPEYFQVLPVIEDTNSDCLMPHHMPYAHAYPTNDLRTPNVIDQIIRNSHIEPNVMSPAQLENLRKGIDEYMHHLAYQQGFSDGQRQMMQRGQGYKNNTTSHSTVPDQFPCYDKNR